MRFLIIQHVNFEGPANIETWITSKSFRVKTIKPYLGDNFPALDTFDNLIIMGGPMSVHDEHQHPWLSAEKSFIFNTIEDQSKKIMGICLGSQLIALVLKTPVYRNSQTEIGWHPVKLDEAEFMSQLGLQTPAEETVFHWHGEAYDLPYGATLLASSETTRVQAYILEKRILGLLFHLEMNEDAIESIIKFARADLEQAGKFIQEEGRIRAEKYHTEINKSFLFSILEHFFNPTQ